jgi:cyclomaltodextrinase
MIEKGTYRHYKGNLYEVIGTARHSETLEEFVVYKALYQDEGNNLWVRPLKMFTENIMINDRTVPRFERI